MPAGQRTSRAQHKLVQAVVVAALTASALPVLPSRTVAAWVTGQAVRGGAVQPGGGWTLVAVGTTASLRGISVVSERTIWASGTRGTFIRSTDAGETWSVGVVPGGADFDLRAIHARSDLVAHVAATAGRIWRTTDGGRSWSLRYQSPDTAMFLDAIVFTGDRAGYALGDPMGGRFVVLVTHDGGETWSMAPEASRPPAEQGEAAFAASGTSLVFSGRQHAWLGTGGTEARVYRSTDGGSTWNVSPSALPPRAGSGGVFSVAFADSLRGVVVGGDYERPDSATGTAAYSTDGGRTWRASGRPPGGYRSGVAICSCARGLLAIAVGTNGTDVSRDGGATWSALDGTGFNAVAFAPSGTAFAVGGRGRVGIWNGQNVR